MSAPQRSLFDDEDDDVARRPELVAKPVSLVLRPQPGRPLNKAQRAFNRLVEKIERLRTKLARDAVRYDAAVVFHHEHVRPLAERATAMRKDVVRMMAGFLNDKRFKAKADRRVLKTILQEQLLDITGVEGTLVDEDLRAVFKTVHGIDFEQAEAEEAEHARKAMEEVFSQQGVDVDLSAFRPGMTPEEAAAHSAEIIERLKRAAAEGAGSDPWSETPPWAQGAEPPRKNPKKNLKKKTKRQLAAEAREQQIEELRKKSIGTIYRQLAKVLHPDLEQDPERRVRKGALMQDVTAAYRNNDLHTLLRLELEWIRREEADVARLTDETLDLYNDLLEEQAAELDLGLEELRMHPKYSVLAVMTGPFSSVLDTDGPAKVRRFEGLITSFEESLVRLRSADGWIEVREVIRLYRTNMYF